MRNKLFLSFLAIAIIAIMAILLFVRLDNPRQIRAYMVGGGMVGLEDLVNALQEYHQTYGKWDGVELFLKTEQENPMSGHRGMMSQRIRLVDPTGKVIYDSTGVLVSQLLNKDELARAIVLTGKAGNKIGFLLPENAMPFNEKAGADLATRLNETTIRAGLIAALIALILATILSWQLNRPVQQLTMAAKSFSRGDLSKRVEVKGKDELADLSKSFNQMAESLDKSEQRRKVMTSDIAHELRTPLSVQRAHLEAMLDGITNPSKKNLTILLDQNSHLTRLVNDLRVLAMADAGELRLTIMPVDLRSAVEKVLDKFKATLDNRKIKAVILPSKRSRIKIKADPDRLEQILTNLISNASTFSPAGGIITLELGANTDQASIKVLDEGQGIPEESLTKIFDRFYRVESSRSHDRGGSGLGLAIAQQLALAQGGTITAANCQEGGAVFTLTLPLAVQKNRA